MTLSRLLAAALVICSVAAFAQDHPASKLWPSSPPSALVRDTPATAGEPWRIIPNLAPDHGSGETNTHPDQFAVDIKGPYFKTGAHSRPLILRADGAETDLTCYTIRSYVVARDSKDSESTHPAGYSTCRPSDRYQVRTTEMRVGGR